MTPPAKKPLVRRVWFWILVVLAIPVGLFIALIFLGAILTIADGTTESGDSGGDASASAAPATVSPSPSPSLSPSQSQSATASAPASPSDLPAETQIASASPSESLTSSAPAFPSPSESPQTQSLTSFILGARGDIRDMDKDLDDMEVALGEGGIFRLLGNSLELSFNIGQLQSLTPPQEIAAQWNKSLETLSSRADDLSSMLSGDATTRQISGGINATRKALTNLSKVVDKVDQ